jgi:hypothetical protein
MPGVQRTQREAVGADPARGSHSGVVRARAISVPGLPEPLLQAAGGRTGPESDGRLTSLGFYLWIDGELAWAQGTYEYRPMGTAVVSTNDLFRRRDFSARRKAPKWAEYIGQFASIGHVNQELMKRRVHRGGAENAEATRRETLRMRKTRTAPTGKSRRPSGQG